MVSTIRFDRASRDRVFDDLARIIDPQRVHIALEGYVHDLAIEVDLEIADGRLVSAKSGNATGARAMLRLALATSAELTLITGARPPHTTAKSFHRRPVAPRTPRCDAAYVTIRGYGSCTTTTWRIFSPSSSLTVNSSVVTR